MKSFYKILFEVKLLHEYYLTNPDNSSVFQAVKQADRLAWLSARYASDEPAISNYLEFVLPPAMSELFNNQRLILLQSYSGFQVAVQVNTSLSTGSVINYAPLVPMGGDFNFLILIRQTTGQIDQLTNGRMDRPVESLYYFSNEPLTAPKVAPILSNPISPQSATYAYEQGELVDLGSSIGICYYTGAARIFPPIAGNGFANENDRLIVGTEFEYSLDPTAGVTQATFTLKDHAGNPVRSMSVTGQTPLDTVTLNFDDGEHPSEPALVALPTAKASDPILYSLQVTGNNGYSDTRNLIFYDQPADLLSTWGVIQIQTAVSNVDFNLLDTNGNLINKPPLPSPDVSSSPYPVFEIRCKSRYTFWRYLIDDPSLVFDAPTGGLLDFVQATGQTLTTLTPVSSTHLPHYFSTNSGAATPSFTYLPNPGPNTVIEIDGKQVCSDIRVPESALFPTSPAS